MCGWIYACAYVGLYTLKTGFAWESGRIGDNRTCSKLQRWILAAATWGLYLRSRSCRWSRHSLSLIRWVNTRNDSWYQDYSDSRPLALSDVDLSLSDVDMWGTLTWRPITCDMRGGRVADVTHYTVLPSSLPSRITRCCHVTHYHLWKCPTIFERKHIYFGQTTLNEIDVLLYPQFKWKSLGKYTAYCIWSHFSNLKTQFII